MESPAISMYSYDEIAPDAAVQAPFGSRVFEYLVTLVNDPRTTATRLSAVIGWNPMLARSVAARVRAEYGFSGRVCDLELAVSTLGAAKLREILKRTIADIAMRHMEHTFQSCPELWNHLLTCALVSRVVARRLGGVNPAHAFVAGLVHDVGMLLLLNRSSFAGAAPVSAWTLDEDIANQEHAVCTAFHEETGSRMLEHWETLPPEVHDAVRHHHMPVDAVDNPRLTSVVHAADMLCHRLYGEPRDRWPSFVPEVSGLTVERILERRAEGSEDAMISAALQSEILDDLPALSLKVAVLRENLVTALEDFPEHQRLVLALHYCEGISMPSIAGILDSSIDDVRLAHTTAIQHLKGVLSDVGEDV
jgi:HD-like signal output (HDOD) protein